MRLHWHMRSRSAVRILLVATLVMGCGGSVAPDPVIDGWAVGEPLECVGEDALRCPELLRVGLAELDRRSPGHGAVATAALHREGVDVDPVTGDRILRTRSGGGLSVLLITLVDGSTVAIGVGYPGISREAMAFPWGPITRR